jgi:hypothetical protein
MQFADREKMIRDMYERIFKAVKEAAENNCEQVSASILSHLSGSIPHRTGPSWHLG